MALQLKVMSGPKPTTVCCEYYCIVVSRTADTRRLMFVFWGCNRNAKRHFFTDLLENSSILSR